MEGNEQSEGDYFQRAAPVVILNYDVCVCVSVSWIIYECMADLLLTLSTTAGACHSNMVPHILLSTINTEVFHSNTYYPFPPLSLPVITLLICFSPDIFPLPFLQSLSFYFISLSNQRQAKYTENKLKAIKARNEYLLALEATNSCVFKYYIHDLADIIDVSINTSCYTVGAYICGHLVCMWVNTVVVWVCVPVLYPVVAPWSVSLH